MRLTDTLFYWLQTKLMTDCRPDDEAARDSLRFFAQILSEDHGAESMEVEVSDSAKIYVSYRDKENGAKTVWFDREAAEQLRNEMYGMPADLDDEDSEVN